jgi:hypothetical protein
MALFPDGGPSIGCFIRATVATELGYRRPQSGPCGQKKQGKDFTRPFPMGANQTGFASEE